MIEALGLLCLFVAAFWGGFKFGRDLLRSDIRVARNRGEDIDPLVASRSGS